MARKRRTTKGRAERGTFAAIPHVVMDSADFRALSGAAHKVLMWLLRQYNGKNNGDLSASFTQIKAWGINSRTTLAKALKELQQCGLIICTRDGQFINPGGHCALYALTWQSIDECAGKLDTSPTITPIRQFSLERTKHPAQKVDAVRPESGRIATC